MYSVVYSQFRTYLKVHGSSSMREGNPREKWWQIKLIFFLFHEFNKTTNAYLGNSKIKFVEAVIVMELNKKMLRFFCAQHGRFFHLTLIFPSHTHLSMQMVELILPVAIKTRTYTGRRGNRATFISGISHFAVWKNLWTLKLCVCSHIERCAHLNIW